jgi:hypothetical protein
MPVISVEHLSKAYHLGQIGTGTFTNDLKVWWAKVAVASDDRRTKIYHALCLMLSPAAPGSFGGGKISRWILSMKIRR